MCGRGPGGLLLAPPAEPVVAVPDPEPVAAPATVYRSEQGLLAPRTRQRYQQVQDLLARGATIRAYARELGLVLGASGNAR